MELQEILNITEKLKEEIKQYIVNTPHYLLYWIANKEVQSFIREYPNDYEENVSIEVNNVASSPEITIYFNEHPDGIECIIRYCVLKEFKDAVEKEWAENQNNIKDYQVKELTKELNHYKKRVEDIKNKLTNLNKQ